ncbi:MAG: lipopolysaccharide kinase InaA family protein [Phycisphaerae bacterium]|nr:lipopolysaccharide kinase InaA family protein [Phycisphaerae bacterium]
MIVETDRMHVDSPYRQAIAEAGLASVEAVLTTLGDRLVAWSRTSDTIFASLPRSNTGVYIKRYHYPRWRQRVRLALRGTVLRSSRARAEFRILRNMRRHGIQAVRPIAWGERRRYGTVRSCFLMTEAVPESMALSSFIHTFGGRHSSYRTPAAMRARRVILTTLAEQIRFMHNAGFVHRDLFWRNVLIRPLPNQEFEFYFLDASVGRRIRVRQWRKESIVRDLAAIAVLAPEFCSRADQLRFIRVYLDTERIDDEARRWMELVQQRARGLRSAEQQRMFRERVFDRIRAEPVGIL